MPPFRAAFHRTRAVCPDPFPITNEESHFPFLRRGRSILLPKGRHGSGEACVKSNGLASISTEGVQINMTEKPFIVRRVFIAAVFLAGVWCVSCVHDPYRDLQSDNPVTWSEAVDRLSAEKDPRLVDPLIDALKNGSRHVRKKAAETLGRLGDPRAVDPLILALTDEYWEVRRNAVRSLARLGDARALSPLVSVLRDEEYDVRYAAVGALKAVGPPAVPPLVDSLAGSNANVRQGAAEILTSLGWRPGGDEDRVHYLVAKKAWDELSLLETPSIPMLVAALKYDDEATRKGVEGALRKMGKRATGTLVQALEHGNSLVRERAAEILNSMSWRPEGTEEEAALMIARREWHRAAALGGAARALLVNRLCDRDGAVRQGAARALDETGWRPATERERIERAIALQEWERVRELGASAREPLVGLLSDDDAGIRKEAVVLLGAAGDRNAVPFLNDMLMDDACDVRKAAVGVLGEMGDERSLEPLIGAMQDRGCDVRRESAEALEGYGTKAVPLLLAVLPGRSVYAREGAAVALGLIGDAGAVMPLCDALSDDNAPVRKEAASALGRIADRRATGPLIGLLKDRDGMVREEAVKALGKIAPPEAAGPLTGTLLDGENNSYIRAGAAEALGNIGAATAAEDLRYVLRDPSPRVRTKAAEALGKIGDGGAVEPLAALLADSVFEVRHTAAQALDKTGWVPRTEEERIAYRIAMKEWDDLRETGAAAVRPLVEAMREQDSGVRDDIGETLRYIGAPSVEPLLVELQEGVPSVRSKAALVLGGIGDARALEGLVAALDDSDREVRKGVAEALGNIGDRGAVGALVNHLPDWWAGEAMAEALRKLGWTPRAERDRIHLLVAVRDFESLRGEWHVARTVLVNDMDQRDDRIVENGLFALLETGGDDIIPELVRTMESRGTISMTEAFLNSNRPELIRAAEKWAARRGYRIKKE